MADVDQRPWIDISDDELTVELVRDVLGTADSDEWVVAACADRVVDDESVQEELLKIGLSRTEGTVESVQSAASNSAPTAEDSEHTPSLTAYFSANSTDLLLCQLRALLLERSDRFRTYVAMVSAAKWDEGSKTETGNALSGESGDDEEDAWGDGDEDPWDQGDQTLTSELVDGDKKASVTRSSARPISLSSFLTEDLLHTATFFASSGEYAALTVLSERHTPSIWPYRLPILDAIPDYELPDNFQSLLPTFDFASGHEATPLHKPWRDEADFVELPHVKQAIREASTVLEKQETPLPKHDDPLTAEELSDWYQQRVEKIDSSSGMIDAALALVQHGASQGIPHLDLLGEDLSLLARLVYDTAEAASSHVPKDWTLSQWRSMDVNAVVDAYLASSTPASVASDIRRLVMPYLYVLEARAERAGNPDPQLPQRHLHRYILDCRMDIAAAIFEQSKPTLSQTQRIVKNDEDVARLALAYLYGSDRLTDWSTMSRIFECLPAWPNITGEDEMDEADTTLASLAGFVTPSTTQSRVTAHDLLFFFSPLPRAALTRALDVLDIHLECGEILSRWDVPAPLRWFLQSANDLSQQKAWATRMVRAAAAKAQRPGSKFTNEGEWVKLMDDMVKLTEGGEGPLRPAFGLLNKEEILKIFFGGLLSSGNFKLAGKLLMLSSAHRPLSSQAIEELYLSTSREFYDNAESGNLHSGDMKLAYDCLNSAPATHAIRKEREFIEATSRLCSYNLKSRSGNPLSPIEIRLTKDKLSLIAQLLSNTDDIYKYPEVVLDLVDKLGYREDLVAHIKALGMIATTALQSEDFATSANTIDTMVQKTMSLLTADPDGAENTSSPTFEALTVCWQTCYQLGEQSEYHDPRRKMQLLSNALKICPAENIPDVLTVWRKAEEEVEKLPDRDDPLSPQLNQKDRRTNATLADSTRNFVSHLPDLHLRPSTLVNPDAAAMAARTFNRVAANFTFPGRGRTTSITSEEQSVRSDSRSPDLSHQARSVFTRGVGWLIGADEKDGG